MARAGNGDTDGQPSSPPRLPTGIPGFDSIAEGGLVRGRGVLAVGTSGTGKTIFGLQFLVAGVREFGQPGVHVTFEEPPEDVVRNAESFGWDLRDLVADGSITFVDASPDTVDGEDFDFGGLVHEIERAVANVGAKRVVLDSIGALLPQFRDPFTVRRGLRRIIEALRPLGVTTVVTAERATDYGPIARFDVEDFVVDGIVVLRHPLERRTRSRTIEIVKLRGASHLGGEYPFTIRKESGIEVIPRPAFEVKQRAATDRVTTGNADLDRICGGGYFRDSVVLVSGATGTGKTLLGCAFIDAAAAADGERALYLSFEESRNQLVRNAASWGFDLEEREREGSLRLEFRRPERMLLEDLLLEIRALVEESKPTRIVVDGLTSLERSSLPEAFREFTVAVLSYMKENEITVVFTDTASLGMQSESNTEAHISTMTDVIMLLRYVERAGEARRGLAVLKMRGTAHDAAIQEYQITDHGLEMLGPMTDVVGFIPGAPLSSGSG